MKDFLPSDYQIPQKSNYTKFNQGETIVRILESPILGWELWKDNKPVRFNMTEDIPMSIVDGADVDKHTGQPKTPRHFWAMVVWNYEEKCLQVWEITQKSIMQKIKGLSKSKAWGSPLEYDLSVTKTGEGMDTSYEVMPCPKEKVDKSILEAYEKSKINVSALYKGDDPFNKEKDENDDSQFVKDVEESLEDDSIPF
jgi:hypothetical protein